MAIVDRMPPGQYAERAEAAHRAFRWKTGAADVTNEAFARVKVDQLLKDADWKLTDGISIRYEYPLDDGGKADYALFDRQGRAVAILEAKSTSIDLTAGEAQGRRYADCLKVPFIFLSNGEEVWFCDKEQDAHFRKVETVFSQDDLVRRRATKDVRRNPLDLTTDGGFTVSRSEIDWEALDETTRAELERLFADSDPLTVDPTPLERKFTIPERNRAMVREFRDVLENGYTGLAGARRAPDWGKTIVFAVTKRHAESLARMLDQEFADKKPSPNIATPILSCPGLAPMTPWMVPPRSSDSRGRNTRRSLSA